MEETVKLRLETINPTVLSDVLNDVDQQMVALHLQLIQFSIKIVIFTQVDRTRTQVEELM